MITRVRVMAESATDLEAVSESLEAYCAAGGELDVELLRNAGLSWPWLERVQRPVCAVPTRGTRKTAMIRRIMRFLAHVLPARAGAFIAQRYGPSSTADADSVHYYISLSPATDWRPDWVPDKRRGYTVVGHKSAVQTVHDVAERRVRTRLQYLTSAVRKGELRNPRLSERSDWRFLVEHPYLASISLGTTNLIDDAVWVASHQNPAVARDLLAMAAHRPFEPNFDTDFESAAEYVALWAGESDGAAVPDIAERVRIVADSMLKAGDRGGAARWFTRQLMLLFHAELHNHTTRSPLVEDPDTWLASLRRSAVRRAILEKSTPDPDRASNGRAREVVAVSGSYPKFSFPVIDALSQKSARVRHVIPGEEDRRFIGSAPNEFFIRLALGLETTPEWEWLDLLPTGGEALFLDWADRAALVALMRPHHGRATMRVHSVDVLSCWIHLIDLDSVDAILVVSEPMGDLVASIARPPAGTRVESVPNVVDVNGLRLPKRPRARRTLGMIGWGQQVKDPLWALELLARLRSEDESWRLVLVGTDFAPKLAVGATAYAERFRTRILDDDVRTGIEFAGYRTDLDVVLRDIGFILSTSLRESFHVGLMEGIASGAVPVIRNWPAFSRFNVAARLTRPDWVVSSVEEAALAVLNLSEEQAWSEASEVAADWAAQVFAARDVAKRYTDIVLGSDHE